MPLVSFTLFTHTSLIVIGVVPVLLNVIVTLVGLVVVKDRFVICPCSVAMKLNVSAPIHAATAMLTATVTAMSMIEATTGLRAFLLFNIFILFYIPPFGVTDYLVEAKLLNLTTPDTRLLICMTKILPLQRKKVSLTRREC
jgi:hypothetical protein